MEILIFFLVILVVASIIGIAMVSFKVGFTSLLKVKVLEEELIQLKKQLVKPTKLNK